MSGLDPAGIAAPPIWTGSVGPKSLAVTGRAADGWVVPGGSDWRSKLYRESRPRIDDAAAAAGRDPAEIADIFNFGGRITPEPLAVTRGDDGRWIGGSERQWVDELTDAVLEYGARGLIYRSTDDTPAAEALARWASEIVPAVRGATEGNQYGSAASGVTAVRSPATRVPGGMPDRRATQSARLMLGARFAGQQRGHAELGLGGGGQHGGQPRDGG